MRSADYRTSAPRVHGPVGLSSHRPRPISASRAAALLAAAVAALVLVGPAAGSLRAKLDRALAAPGVSSSRTGATVYDLARGRFVYRHNSTLALKPASNEKLPIAVAALSALGLNYTIPTEVRGDGHMAAGGVWRGRIVLKGYGDPALSGRDLGKLARAVANAGITRVTGAVIGDESFFDTARVAPGWKASYYKNECPPLSALIVSRAHFKGQMTSDPALAAAKGLRAKLVDRGIRVGGGTRVEKASASSHVLGTVESPGLRWLVRRMNRQSDNFIAEMLLKELGAVERGRGTTRAGTRVVRGELTTRAVPLAGVVLADGSGLSELDQLTAKAVAKLLMSALADTQISSVFVESLPLAGTSGTLADRMRRGPAYRNVRAKTGTTSSASALSGYVRTRFVFSILMNGSPIPWWYARQAQDRFAQVLARQ